MNAGPSTAPTRMKEGSSGTRRPFASKVEISPACSRAGSTLFCALAHRGGWSTGRLG
jgi:hypothetical protein